MLKKVASFVLDENPQRTPHRERAVLAARGGRVTIGTPPVSSRLRPCWTTFLNIPLSAPSIST